MFRRIVYAYDPERLAEAVLPMVAAIARAGGAEVLAVSVHEASGPRPLGALTEALESAAERLRAQGVDVRTQVRATFAESAARGIVEAASEFHADLVAMGSHGRGALSGLVLGAVGRRVAARLEIPVLVATADGDGGRPEPATIRRILVAVDADTGRFAAAAATRDLAVRHGAEVLLAHAVATAVIGGSRIGKESPERITRLLFEAVAELGPTGAAVTTRLLPGDRAPAAEIAGLAEAWSADLIVVGSRRLTGLRGVLIGSTTQELLRLTDRPVLLAEHATAVEARTG